VIGEGAAGEQLLIHVGLAAREGVQNTESFSVVDMRPPLHAGGNDSSIAAHAIGAAELSDDELQKMKVFVDRHAGEHSSFLQLGRSERFEAAPRMYCVLPHAVPLEEEDGRYVRTRFSCVGFVYEAYRTAGIELLNIDRVPPVEYEVLKRAYPVIEMKYINRADFGLEGDGPWPVLLCGYLFHSLKRDSAQIRAEAYSPRAEDRFF